MRWHTEDPCNLIDLELPCLQELSLLRTDTDRRVLHALFQNGNLICIAASSEGRLPAFPHLARILNSPRMLQHTGRSRTVRKELAAILFGSDCQPYRILGHSDRTVSNQTVKSKTRNVQHIVRLKPYGSSNLIGAFPAVHIVRIINGVLVIKPSMLITSHLHPIRHQRIQRNNFTLAIADDLTVGVAPKEQMRHQSLPEDKGSHLRIRLIMEQKIKRMFHRFLLTAIIGISVKL